MSGWAYRHASLYPLHLLLPARTRDCTLLAEPLLGLQLNPLCKFMTNELLFAVFTSPTQKETQNMPAMRLGTPLPRTFSLSVSVSFSMVKWVFLCAVACCVYAKSIASQGDGICYLMFDFKVPVPPLFPWLPPSPWQSREWKSATVAKEAIKHKACR